MAASTAELSTETQVILTALRQELKAWETSFAAAHQGRKAGREDIKQHLDIEEKYKQYNKLRYPSQRPPASKTATPTKKRHRSTVFNPPLSQNISNKRSKPNHSIHDSIIATYDPPTSTSLSPTTHRTFIGPTPQKDGQVLGLFDRLSTTPKSNTPSKRGNQLLVASLIHATPSKQPSSEGCIAEPTSTGKRHRKSPLTTSKQAQLNAFLTPSASRILNGNTPGTRHGVSKLRFDETPAFLRRDSQRAYTGKENGGLEENISWSPVAVRKLPNLAGRGLSALVKGLRDMEDEKLDEELEMLRDMEGDYAPAIRTSQPKIFVEDNQTPDMPLGPDGAGECDDDSGIEKAGKGRDGKPLKVWKKKGQKRTTRRVLMKPNIARWKPEPAWKGEVESEEEGEKDVVEESQGAAHAPKDDQEEYKDELVSEDEAERASGQGKPANQRRNGTKASFASKVKKKISATAHANFRALKIKNKQSKGKRGGRFGRKR